MKILKYIGLIFIIVILVIIVISYLKPTLITKTALPPIIQYQCEAKLEDTKVWQTAALFLSHDEQKILLEEVCACVAEHATDDVSPKELIHAVLDENAKIKLTNKAFINSIVGCAEDYILKQP